MKECLWYNGEMSYYLLLDFNPNELSKKEIKKKAWEILKKMYSFDEGDKEAVMENLYLIDVDNLESLK